MSALRWTSVGWLVVLRIYVALAVRCISYRHLEEGDKQSLKFNWRGGESNPGPLAPQAKSLTTRPPPLPKMDVGHTSLHNTYHNYTTTFPKQKPNNTFTFPNRLSRLYNYQLLAIR